MTAVHFVVPDGIDDPARPSGGNVYDRRVIDGLAELGWVVHERRVAWEGFPGQPGKPDVVRGNPPACRQVSPDQTAHEAYAGALVDVLGRIPGGELVVVDGLLTSDVPEVVARHAQRLRLVVLLHLPLDTPAEREVLSTAAGVVATSQWTRRWLLDRYGMSGDRIHIVEPGADLAELAPGTQSGGELLCVGAVTPTKGHDLLVEALAEIDDLDWRCVCVGALDLAPDFVDRVRGSGDRVGFAGPLTGSALDDAYAGADLLVSASRAETYGMVVTEALARGLPVVATEVGGLPEALGRTETGEVPGLLVPPDDAPALAAALRRWLTDADLREQLRKTAQARRLELADWSDTSSRLSRVLAEVSG